jgi:RsiW-degrading membrane proteinase PrsW (M82 family)
MSHPGQNTSLSLSARLLCYLGPLSTILLTAIASPQAALLSPFAFLPTALFFRKWRESNDRNPSSRGELEPMIWTYAAAGTVGLTTVALVQIVICKAATTILFRSGNMGKAFWTEFARSTINGLIADELARRAELAASWQNWAFISIITYVTAGFVEETLKYLPITYARRRGTPKQRQLRNRAYIDYALAGALSFSVVETIAFLYASCEKGHETWAKLVLTLFERIVLGQLGHLSVASLTALRAIRRDYYGDQLSWWGIVGPSVILHGTFDFVAMAGSALEGNVGWIHPTGVRLTVAGIAILTGLVATTVWQVRQEWISLENRDRASKSSKDNSVQLSIRFTNIKPLLLAHG